MPADEWQQLDPATRRLFAEQLQDQIDQLEQLLRRYGR
jgi:hypothetical protein